MRVINGSRGPDVYHMSCECGALIECEIGERCLKEDKGSKETYKFTCPCCHKIRTFTKSELRFYRFDDVRKRHHAGPGDGPRWTNNSLPYDESRRY